MYTYLVPRWYLTLFKLRDSYFIGIIKRGRYWLDITDLLNPKDWKLMSGRSSITFSDWTWVAEDATSANMTVYNGSDAQNCVYMSAEYAYTWSTANCDEKMNFLCYSTG